MRLTHQQSAAITTHDVSIALSAGAGCGKTFVLTERFISYFRPDANENICRNIGDIVAITFTEAAAREMRQRVRRRCQQCMQETSGSEVDAWWRLIQRLDAARIKTIHGFCTSLLKEYSVEAGIDPRFTVLDDSTANVLRLQALDELLREELAKEQTPLIRLARDGRIEHVRQGLLDLLLKNSPHEFARWSMHSADDLAAVWARFAKQNGAQLAGRVIASSIAARRTLTAFTQLDPQLPKAIQKGAVLKVTLEELAAGRGSEALIHELHDTAKLAGMESPAKWRDKDRRDIIKKALEQLRKKILDTTFRDQLFTFDAEASRPAAVDGLAMLQLAIAAENRYHHAKRLRAGLDFDDLIERAVTLLTSEENSQLRENVADSTFAVLVDEFQDTDQRQLELVSALCGNAAQHGKLFCVGDHKQSIYRFRGAQPKVFHDLSASLPQRGRQSLTVNFRSQPAILNFVNALFVYEFGDAYEPLVAHKPQVSPEPAVEFLWTHLPKKWQIKKLGDQEDSPASTDEVPVSADEARQSEAATIARRIREMLNDDTPLVWDEKAPPDAPAARRVWQGDIAILFRALTDVQSYEAALRAEGIDYYLEGGHAFYAQQEIHDVVHLLRAVASEADELALVGALRSPFFSLADETIFWLNQRGGTVNASLRDNARIAELPDSEQTKFDRAKWTILDLRGKKERLGIAALLIHAIDRTGYDAILLSEFLGERKLANLNKLLDQARAADAAGTNLQDFVQYQSQFITHMPKEAPATTISDAADVVRLLTIHNAKGLEFPVVVLADLNRGARVSSDNVSVDEHLGPVIAPPESDVKKPPIVGRDLVRLNEQYEESQEALRILYVACTRAADRLILSASRKEGEVEQEQLARVAGSFDLSDGQCLHDLLADYGDPYVDVRTVHVKKLPMKSVGVESSPLGNVLKAIKKRSATTGGLPNEVLPLSPQSDAVQEFSFSRISGALSRAQQAADDDSGEGVPRRYSQPEATAEMFRSVDAARDEAIALGQIVHDTLQIVPLGNAYDVEAVVRRQARVHLAAHMPARHEPIVGRALQMVQKVVSAPRFAALRDAQQLAREVEFLLDPTSTESSIQLRHFSGESGPLLTGVIDCLYQDAVGDWHVLDYKTNRVDKEHVQDVATKYQLQLHIYALAVEQILGTRPVELVLWFLDPDVEVSVPVDSLSRLEILQSVEAAMKVAN